MIWLLTNQIFQWVTWLSTNQISATHCMHGCVRRQQLANRGIITHVNLSRTKPPYKHKTNGRHHTETKQGFTEQWPRAVSSQHVPRLKIWAALIYTYHTAEGLSANTGPHWLLISEKIPTLRCSFLVQPQVNNEPTFLSNINITYSVTHHAQQHTPHTHNHCTSQVV